MGTIADKLNTLKATKAALKAAINGSGNTVGDKFSDYPIAVTNGKSLIAAAVTDKGVETAADATFQQMATNIGAIETGGGPGTVSFREISRVDYWRLSPGSNKMSFIKLFYDGTTFGGYPVSFVLDKITPYYRTNGYSELLAEFRFMVYWDSGYSNLELVINDYDSDIATIQSNYNNEVLYRGFTLKYYVEDA